MAKELRDIFLGGTLAEINVGGTTDAEELVTRGEMEGVVGGFFQAADLPDGINDRMTSGDQANIFLGGTSSGDAVQKKSEIETLIADSNPTVQVFTVGTNIGETLSAAEITAAIGAGSVEEEEPFVIAAPDKKMLVIDVASVYYAVEMVAAT